MVLQRDIPVRIFGQADAGEVVTVRFASQERSTRADGEGKWLIELDPMPSNEKGQKLKVNTIVLSDILVGDIWLCTGQSNMAGMLRSYISYGDGQFEEYKDEPGDYKNEMIRLFTVDSSDADTPQTDTPAVDKWAVCSPQTSPDFSCTGYFFGKYLQPEAGVPIGLIKSAIGGTGIVSWLPLETMQQNPVTSRIYLDPYKQALERYPAARQRYEKATAEYRAKRAAGEEGGRAPQPPIGPLHPKRPAAYYNGMIFPLHNFSIKGAIWYQGENEGNAGNAEEYKTTFPLMIETWRKRWKQGEFPFVFVQLAAFRDPRDEPSDPQWARLREAQLFTLQTVANTGMAVAIDGGLTKNIHPPYKELVGKRLAAEALRLAYGNKGITQGPLYKSFKTKGNKAILQFENAGSGLISKDLLLDAYGAEPITLSSQTLSGFTVAGEDRIFHPANAMIDGKTVVVESGQVSKPVAVRYAWAEFPLCNLYNKEGFAASPFRTDDWPAAE